MHMHIRRPILPLLLAALLPLAAVAAPPEDGIEAEISADLAEAGEEVSRELAAARRELENTP